MELNPQVLADLIEINMAEIYNDFLEGEQSPVIAYVALSNAIVQFLSPEVTGAFSEEKITELEELVDSLYQDLDGKISELAINPTVPPEVAELQDELYTTRTLVNELNSRLNIIERKEDIKVYIQSTEEGVGR